MQGDQQVLDGDDKNKPRKESPYRAVHDASNSFQESELPGKLVRAEGEPKVEDKAVNQAYANVGTVLKFYKDHFKWNSIDNKNADIISTVHFGEAYENACKLYQSATSYECKSSHDCSLGSR